MLLPWVLVGLSALGFVTVKVQVKLLMSIGDGLRKAYPATDPFLYRLQKELQRPLQRLLYLLYVYLAVIAAPWTEGLEGLKNFLRGLLLLLLILSSIWVIETVKVLGQVFDYWIHRHIRDAMLVLYLIDVIALALIVFRVIVYLLLVSSALSIAVDERLFTLVNDLILTLNFFSLLIGLGLVIPLRNAVSSMLLLFDRPFQLGDQIEIQDIAGVVQKVGLFFVKICQGRSTRMYNTTLQGIKSASPSG